MLTSWEVDLVGVDLVGVDLVGVNLVEGHQETELSDINMFINIIFWWSILARERMLMAPSTGYTVQSQRTLMLLQC